MRGVSARLQGLGAGVFSASVAGLLYLGWRARGQQHLTAESGLGYALGIVGAVMMLLLLLYPLRKKARFMRGWGSVRHWFRAHMLLGILGPALILFHANFELGSLNSNVALIAMLLVAGSGLVGRFLYTKIHYGLYGRRANLEELRADTQALRRGADMDLPGSPRVDELLRGFEANALARRQGVLRSMWHLLILGTRTRRFQRRLRREQDAALRDAAKRQQFGSRTLRSRRRAARRYISAYTTSVRRVAEFSVYDRLFGLWHVFHLPLFMILVLAAIAHVVAVHLY